jgi:hypothetical protein
MAIKMAVFPSPLMAFRGIMWTDIYGCVNGHELLVFSEHGC